MWNGIEDLYMERTGETLPSMMFFLLAGMGNFMYLKTPKAEVKRQAMWNDGRTDKMYERLAPLLGMQYKHVQGKTFSYLLDKAKSEIDKGHPVVLGCLDMYYLEYYPKFYHKIHIPIHYVLMTGYSDEKSSIYLLDCGTERVLQLSYEMLEQALDIQKTGFSDKNGFYTIRLSQTLPGVRELSSKAFFQKAQFALDPPAGFLGIKGMRKLSEEINTWKNALTGEEYRAALMNIVMFTGTVPILPDALLPIEERSGILHMAGREKLCGALGELSKRYDTMQWELAACEFKKSGELISNMTDAICECLLEKSGRFHDVHEYIAQMADIEEKAFEFMMEGAKEYGI